MCLNHFPGKSIPKQSGSMLVISIVIIVVMSILGLALTNILSASADSITHEVLGLRALNSAQSGLEAKVASVFPLSGTNPDTSVCDADDTVDLSAISGLQSCGYTASCEIGYNQDNILYIRFSSIGTCQTDEIVTSRQVSVDAKVET